MSYHVLRLRTLMNRPERIDFSQPMIALDDEQPPALLLLDEPLVKTSLKSDAIAPYDLLAYWKTAARLQPDSLPALNGYFHETPILLNGTRQRETRRALVPGYRRIEIGLDHWLADFSKAYVAGWANVPSVPALGLVHGYLNAVNREIIARDLGCPAQSLPALPHTLFTLLPRSEQLQDYNTKLQALLDDLQAKLISAGRSIEEAWMLVSVSVMGQEALLAGLTYGLAHPAPTGRWSAEALMRESAPVSMLVGRRVLQNVTLEGHPLLEGQTIYICPFLAHRTMAQQPTLTQPENTSEASYAFGAGAHVCAGRNIALKMVQAFLNACNDLPDLQIDCSGLKFSRDINLMVSSTHD
jgi:hypothetical protein